MARKDGIGHAPCHVWGNSTLPRHVAEQRGLLEAAHVHRPFDDLAAASELKPAAMGTRYWDAFQVDVRGKPAVHLELAHAGNTAFLKRGEVQISKANRSFDLPGFGSSQKNQADVSLTPLHAIFQRKGGRIG
jgi:hypothetical protein